MISFLVIMDNEDICVGQGSAETGEVVPAQESSSSTSGRTGKA